MERRVSKSSVPREETVPITGPFSPIVLPLAGVVLCSLHLTGFAGFLPPGVRFFLVAFVHFLWPGDILLRRVFALSITPRSLRFLFTLCAGVALHSVIAFVMTVAGSSFTFYALTSKLAVLSLYLFSLYRVARRRERVVQGGFHSGPLSRRQAPVTVALLLVAVWFFLVPGAVQPEGDAYDHIGYVRSIVTQNQVVPQDVLAPVKGDTIPLKLDPRKGSLHPLLALWCEMAELDPAVLWLYLPALFAPAAFLAFLFFSTLLLPGGASLLAVALLFLLFQGGTGREYFATIAYGQHLSMVYFWMLLAAAIESIREENHAPRALLFFLSAGAAFIHIGFMIHFLLAVLSLMLFSRYCGFNWRTARTLALGFFGIALVAFTWKYVSSFDGGNALHTHPQGLLSVGGGAVVSPIEILRRYSLVFFGGVLIIPGLFVIGRFKREARLCIALSALPVLICFNPLVAPLVYGSATYLLHRLVVNIPAFQVIVLIAVSLIAWGRAGRIHRKLIAAFLIFLWVKLFLLPGAGAVRATWANARIDLAKDGIAPQFEEVIQKASQTIPENSVVLSDPLTSYALDAYGDFRLVTVLHQHGNPNDRHAVNRLRASREVLSPFTSQLRSMNWLERFGVEYLVVNAAFEAPVHEFFADWSNIFYTPLRNKYAAPRDNFRVVYASEEVLVIQILGYYLEEERWIPTIPYLQAPAAGVGQCAAAAGGCGVRVTGISVVPVETLPGERIRFRIVYERESQLESLFPVELRIRLDNEEYLAAVGNYPGSKLVRRMRERRGGFLSRHRVDRRLFNGFYPPDMWPIGSPVTEEFEIKLPSALREGRYRVELQFEYESLLPNFSVSDFLYNADSYSSIQCATITVSRSLIR